MEMFMNIHQNKKVAINQYDYSYVEVEIKNEKDERIEFNSNFNIDLLLE